MRKIFLTSAAALMAMSGVAMAQTAVNQAPANAVADGYQRGVTSTNGAPVSSNGGIQYGVGLVETQPTLQAGVPNGIEVPQVFGTEGGSRG